MVIKLNFVKGVLIFFDMGFFIFFGNMLIEELGICIKIVMMVSILVVLEVMWKVLFGCGLEDIY